MGSLTPDLHNTSFRFAPELASASHRRSVEEAIECHNAALRDKDYIFTGDRWALTGRSKSPSLPASCRNLICNAKRSEVKLWITP
jgi:hypothetical protein